MGMNVLAEKIKLKIDGMVVETKKGATILEAARENGIYIPSLCHDDCVEAYGACGICVVEAQGVPKLLRSCATAAADGMDISTRTKRVVSSRKIALELLMSDHEGDCRAPCTLNCPAGTDCQGYVGLIANGEFEEALKLIKEKIPLPASIGRICPHPCEQNCRRRLVEEPVAIAHLKAFAADSDLEKAEPWLPKTAKNTGKSVSIIGGGPGGLSAAYYLLIKGHDVTVYDMMPQMGGMLRYGIPQYRLPKEILDKEIALIKKLGAKLINNVKIGADITLEKICEDSDAVLAAIGAWKSSEMGIQGENLDGVIGGIDFLRAVSLGNPPKIGRRVIVCGGGNTAMDACRTAVRLGADEVSVVYRRTRSEMPADELEVKEAEEEGVIFRFLNNPAEITGQNGKVTGIKLRRMALGEPDASGRRAPVPTSDYETVHADTVIMAIGQRTNADGFEAVKKTRYGTLAADENTFATSKAGVFAVGDATNDGADIAISAIAEAGKAALTIDAYLNGTEISFKNPYYSSKETAAEDFEGEEKIRRVPIRLVSANERKSSFKEIAHGYTNEEAAAEAMRCLECGCREFFTCKLLKTANEYEINPERLKGEKSGGDGNKNEFIKRDPGKCILCGLCVRSCAEVADKTALGLIGRGFGTVAAPAFNLPLDKTSCNNCGLCVKLCPTGALTELSSFKKQVPVEEVLTDVLCELCDRGCTVTVAAIGEKVVRVIPADAGSRDCILGRDALIKGFLSNQK